MLINPFFPGIPPLCPIRRQPPSPNYGFRKTCGALSPSLHGSAHTHTNRHIHQPLTTTIAYRLSLQNMMQIYTKSFRLQPIRHFFFIPATSAAPPAHSPPQPVARHTPRPASSPPSILRLFCVLPLPSLFLYIISISVLFHFYFISGIEIK